MPTDKVRAGRPAKRRVSIVPHTHWDREWYSPFQTFRLRLVDLLDDLLPRLDADPSYAHFMLDGQMAVVDDYLEVRPEAESTLRRLAACGRLSAGPWYILMDEFLVSAETTVRNLQLGLDRAAAFGGAMNVGYLPDMFGHVAQMPQLLAQFGFEHAVVWRGVPSTVDRSAFWWEAPDGTKVRAEYLTPFRVLSPNNSSSDAAGGIAVERGARMPGIPRSQLKLLGEWTYATRASLGLGWAWFDRQYARGDENNRDVHGPLPSYAVAQAFARYRPSRDWELSLKVDNLFERRYSSFGLLGSNFFTGPGNTYDPAGARFV